MSTSRDLTAQGHTIVRTTIAQYSLHQAVKRGVRRQNVPPGSVSFLQRFGGSLTLHRHFHIVFLEGVSLDRSDVGLKARFVTAEPPSDTDIATVLQKISQRVIRTLRRLGYLEAGLDVSVATGYAPLRDTEPGLARTMAASVTQRIACGERAGQKVRRIGSGFGDEGERPALTGPRCASGNGLSLQANTDIPAPRRDQWERLMRYTARGAVSLARLAQEANGDLTYRCNRPWSDGIPGITLSPVALLEKRAAFVPVPRAPLVRDGGCLAPPSRLRAALIPPPRQQGMDGEETKTGTPYWHWARLLGRVFALDMATCRPSLCGRREARRRAAPTQSRQALRPSVVPLWRTAHHCCHSSATVWAEGALRPSPRRR
jgi:hypothetical protein